MYNGIGLQTARGSGTSGYVQANKFFLRGRGGKVEFREFQEGEGAGGITRRANKDILEHDRKRQLELKLALLEETLLEQGYTDEEIQERVAEVRKQLEAAGDTDDGASTEAKRVGDVQTHHIAARKEKAMERLKDAFGLGDIKEGEAFDRDLQEQRKQERIMAKEMAEQQKRQDELAYEKEVKRKEKEKKKEEKEEKRRLKREEKERLKEEEAARQRLEEEERREKKRSREVERRNVKVEKDEHSSDKERVVKEGGSRKAVENDRWETRDRSPSEERGEIYHYNRDRRSERVVKEEGETRERNSRRDDRDARGGDKRYRTDEDDYRRSNRR
eukprot:jgi/Mesen1/7295/ME000373S06352